MAFTLDTLAAELGIDPTTLAAKGDVVAKWNGYLSEADNKYQTATKTQKDALETLEQAKRDQQAINEQIEKFGATEATVAEYRANNAALTAALEEVKKQGFNVTMPNLPTPKANTADPMQELRDRQNLGFQQMGQAMRVQAKFQQIFGKPFADDPIKLVDDAIAARLPVEEYAERKYKFTEESARIATETRQKEVQAGIDAGIKKYKEDNPSTAGNPAFQRGTASRHPQIFKPRDAADGRKFANLPPKERIAQSVARVRASIGNDVA